MIRIIVSVALIICPLLVLIRDWKFNDRRTKKHHNFTRIIIVIWILCSFGAACFVYVDQTQIKELTGNITGGNSFCYLKLLKIKETPNLRLCGLVNDGKFPLYDVKLEILDCNALEEKE